MKARNGLRIAVAALTMLVAGASAGALKPLPKGTLPDRTEPITEVGT